MPRRWMDSRSRGLGLSLFLHARGTSGAWSQSAGPPGPSTRTAPRITQANAAISNRPRRRAASHPASRTRGGLSMDRALREAGDRVSWRSWDPAAGSIALVDARPGAWGDVVLGRKDVPTSYHLSVVLDDALQGVTHVVRGADLFASTDVHALLQRLLGLPSPLYHHHRLLLDEDGASSPRARTPSRSGNGGPVARRPIGSGGRSAWVRPLQARFERLSGPDDAQWTPSTASQNVVVKIESAVDNEIALAVMATPDL